MSTIAILLVGWAVVGSMEINSRGIKNWQAGFWLEHRSEHCDDVEIATIRALTTFGGVYIRTDELQIQSLPAPRIFAQWQVSKHQ